MFVAYFPKILSSPTFKNEQFSVLIDCVQLDKTQAVWINKIYRKIYLIHLTTPENQSLIETWDKVTTLQLRQSDRCIFCTHKALLLKYKWKKCLQNVAEMLHTRKFSWFFSFALPLYRSIATSTATIAPPAVSKHKHEWDTWQGWLLYMHERKQTRNPLYYFTLPESRDARILSIGFAINCDFGHWEGRVFLWINIIIPLNVLL